MGKSTTQRKNLLPLFAGAMATAWLIISAVSTVSLGRLFSSYGFDKRLMHLLPYGCYTVAALLLCIHCFLSRRKNNNLLIAAAEFFAAAVFATIAYNIINNWVYLIQLSSDLLTDLIAENVLPDIAILIFFILYIKDGLNGFLHIKKDLLLLIGSLAAEIILTMISSLTVKVALLSIPGLVVKYAGFIVETVNLSKQSENVITR